MIKQENLSFWVDPGGISVVSLRVRLAFLVFRVFRMRLKWKIYSWEWGVTNSCRPIKFFHFSESSNRKNDFCLNKHFSLVHKKERTKNGEDNELFVPMAFLKVTFRAFLLLTHFRVPERAPNRYANKMRQFWKYKKVKLMILLMKFIYKLMKLGYFFVHKT